jgi:hypothetical protein
MDDKNEQTNVEAGGTHTSTAGLNAMLTLATWETQLIWRRYAAMLTANAIIAAITAAILGTTGRDTQVPHLAVIIIIGILSLLGLLVSVTWLRLTEAGWDLAYFWMDAIKTGWPKSQRNPYDPYTKWCEETNRPEGKRDLIGRYSCWIIWFFILGYGGVIAVMLVYLGTLSCRQ